MAYDQTVTRRIPWNRAVLVGAALALCAGVALASTRQEAADHRQAWCGLWQQAAQLHAAHPEAETEDPASPAGKEFVRLMTAMSELGGPGELADAELAVVRFINRGFPYHDSEEVARYDAAIDASTSYVRDRCGLSDEELDALDA
jgi:hypothetical protein